VRGEPYYLWVYRLNIDDVYFRLLPSD